VIGGSTGIGIIGVCKSRALYLSATGMSLILDLDYKDIQFFEINSAIKGYGGKMVDAVLKDLPKAWNGVVVMD